MFKPGFATRLVLIVGIAVLLSASAAAGSTRTSKTSTSATVTESPRAKHRAARLRHARATRSSSRRHRRSYERFYTSSYADGLTEGDVIAGEDAVVRAAAIEALGNMNGTVVAIDPDSGRVLSMVNQKLALASGAQPCSTIKLTVALAALNERIVDKNTEIALGPRSRMNLTGALAHSNNAYFEALGRRLGFEKVSYYAHEFGLGELAGYNISGEHLGVFPSQSVRRPSRGRGQDVLLRREHFHDAAATGRARCRHRQRRNAVLPAASHDVRKRSPASQPKVKRQLDIAPLMPEIADGMAGAVEYGTARSLRYNFSEEQVLGKTGTCSHDGTRFGWFGSYANTDQRTHRDGGLPTGRTPHLRSQGGRDRRPHVPQPLRPQLLHAGRRNSRRWDRPGADRRRGAVRLLHSAA